MPAGKVFIDTNVILYMHDSRNRAKEAAAMKAHNADQKLLKR